MSDFSYKEKKTYIFALTLLAALFLQFQNSKAQQAQILSHQKISDTAGVFTGNIGDGNWFSSSMTAVGDLDGDQINELIVGQMFDDDGGHNQGAIWFLFLNQDGTVRSHQKVSDSLGNFTGTLNPDDWFGSSVTSLGDLDGDNVPDIAVGASQDDDGGANRGAVWILFLNADGTVKAHQKISDTQGNFTGTLTDGDNFGSALTKIGDLDGDGIVDIAVGSEGDSDGGTERGAVWILFLNGDGTVKAHQKISSLTGGFTGMLANGDHFGTSLACLGDMDNDGVEDIASGALLDDDGGFNRGAIWILFLNTDGSVKAHQKISETAGSFSGTLVDGDELGVSLASLNDFDGDGVTDLLAGAYKDDDAGLNRGASWILYLNADGTVNRYQKISSSQGNFTGALNDGDFFGISASAIGDLNNDGVTDIAVGAVNDDDGGADRGALWVLFMGICMPPLQLDTANATFSTIDLTWTNDSAAGWNIQWDTVGFSLGTGNIDHNVTMPYSLAGLSNTTYYEFYVQDSCGPGDLSVWGGPFRFHVGCDSIVAAFTDAQNRLSLNVDASTSVEAANWYWDFGDGTLDTGQIVNHSYTQDSSYTVSLVAVNHCGVGDTLSRVLTLCDSLYAGFIYSVHFLDLNLSGASAAPGAVAWYWDFGDGTLDSGLVVNHHYTTDSTYTISLIVENRCGERDTAIRALSFCDSLYASFSDSAHFLDVTFDAASSAPGAISWAWDLGDGTVDSTQVVNHTYAQDSSYTVSLIVTNRCGLSDTLTRTMAVCDTLYAAYTDSVHFLDATFDAGMSALGAVSWLWDFGDGTMDSGQVVSHHYSIDSIYTVSLIVENHCGERDTLSRLIAICDTLYASFSDSTHFLDVTFDASLSAPGAVSWLWDFGDGNADSGQVVNHHYTVDSTYMVSLIVTNRCGISDTVSHTQAFCDSLYAAYTDSADFLDVTFDASPSSVGVVNWYWDFGDGTLDTGQVVSHIYAMDSTYTVSLIVENRCGDRDTLYRGVDFCDPLSADFASSVHFLDVTFDGFLSSPGTVNWLWDFGDGTIDSGQVVNHHYTTDSTYSVTLIIENRCEELDTLTRTITVCDSLYALFSDSIHFLAISLDASLSSSGALNWYWDFDDGTLDTGLTVSHTYLMDGTYTISLIVENRCAVRDTFTTTFDLCDSLYASFTDTTHFLDVTLDAISSSSSAVNWYWDFGDGTIDSGQVVNHSYATDSIYTISLVVTNYCGDRDTLSQLVPVCDSLYASFTDTAHFLDVTLDASLSSSGTTNWYWDFGDGTLDTGTVVTHHYASDSTYTILLIAENRCGLRDTLSRSITVCDSLYADFNESILLLDATFNAFFSSAGANSWYWDLGDGSVDSGQVVTHQYQADSNYTVSLIAGNRCGDSDTLSRQFLICNSVQAAFTHSINLLQVNFDASGSSANAVNWYWDFDDGTLDTGLSVSHAYATDGTYQVTLTVENLCGDQATFSVPVQVCSLPVAAFTETSSGLTVTLDAQSSSANAISWSWDFGDNTTGAGQQVTHTYATAGTYTVQLIVENVCGDRDTTELDVLFCDRSIPRFTFTIVSTTTTSMTVDFDGTASAGGNTYLWRFGDGNTNNSSLTPTHTYGAPGLGYLVTLVTINACGDRDSVTIPLYTVGVEEQEAGIGQLKLFPNPVKGPFHISFTALYKQDIEVQLMDLFGRGLDRHSFNNVEGKQQYSFSLEGQPAGVYFLHLRSEKGLLVKRILLR